MNSDLREATARLTVVSASRSIREEQLKDYVSKVEELGLPDFWLVAIDNRHIRIPVGPKSGYGLGLEAAALSISQVHELRNVRGFADFVVGWRNGPQVVDSMAELHCARVLRMSRHTLDLEFGSTTGGIGKRVDLVWTTTHGKFAVEVKSTSALDLEVSEKIERLSRLVDAKLAPFVETLQNTRVDVIVSDTGGRTEKLTLSGIEALREDLVADRPGAEFRAAGVRIVLSRRADEPPGEGPLIRNMGVRVGAVSTSLGHSTAYLSVAKRISGNLDRTLREKLRKARAQIRATGLPGIIFLSTSHVKHASAYAEEAMPNDAYSGIPLMIITDGEEARFVYRHVTPPPGSQLDDILPVLALPPQFGIPGPSSGDTS